MKNMLKLATVNSLLITVFSLAVIAEAPCQELFLFRDAGPGSVSRPDDGGPGRVPAVSLTFSDDGGLLIRIGSTRVTLAYNPPLDRYRSTEPQSTPRREQAALISGISLTASLTF
jgi:hypothetical protein